MPYLTFAKIIRTRIKMTHISKGGAVANLGRIDGGQLLHGLHDGHDTPVGQPNGAPLSRYQPFTVTARSHRTYYLAHIDSRFNTGFTRILFYLI